MGRTASKVLTPGELRIVRLLAVGGLTQIEVGIYLGLSDSTIKREMTNARSRLKCSTTAQLIYIATKKGMLH